MTLPRLCTLPMNLRSTSALALVALALIWGGCDAGFEGEPTENRAPETSLAVRDTSLVDNICGDEPSGNPCTLDDDLLTSTVFVSWSGTDSDGFVEAYELRFYDDGASGGEWTRTASRDTLVLLPIAEGSTANVVFEVRAIDDRGAIDPTPAQTVFPIRNSPPSLRLVGFDLPPDTTWTVFSFGWAASDPEGEANLAAVEVALNDPEAFVQLPPDAAFATFVATETGAGQVQSPVRVFLGRAFSSTEITLPGLLLDADNTLYVRAVDQTGATSETVQYPNPDPDAEETWFVQQPTSDVLLVNDFRSERDVETLPFHEDVLAGYLGGAPYDTWDLSAPVSAELFSSAIPANADPTLRETLKLWRYVYWVSDGVTDRTRGNNLALAASVIDDFFATGGKLFVQVPFGPPQDSDFTIDNPAFDILPADALVLADNGATPNLRIRSEAELTPLQAVPGTGRALPTLQAARLITGTVPFEIGPATTVPLYSASFYDADSPNQADWEGTSVVASMDTEQRVGLVALQLYERGSLRFTGVGGDEDAPRQAIQYILEGLGFPGSPQR